MNELLQAVLPAGVPQPAGRDRVLQAADQGQHHPHHRPDGRTSSTDRLEDKQLTVDLTDAAKEFIIDAAYDPIYGARPLRRYPPAHGGDPHQPQDHRRPGGARRHRITVDCRDGELHRGQPGGAHRRGHRPDKKLSSPDQTGGPPEALPSAPPFLIREQKSRKPAFHPVSGTFSAVSRVSNYASRTCTQEAKRSFAGNFFAPRFSAARRNVEGLHVKVKP